MQLTYQLKHIVYKGLINMNFVCDVFNIKAQFQFKMNILQIFSFFFEKNAVMISNCGRKTKLDKCLDILWLIVILRKLD